MAFENHKYHYTYKITNLLNDKYYLGMHSTNNLKDGYLGSGKIIKASVAKYGRKNFEKEISEHFDTREELRASEEELVNQEQINNKLCMNLQLGGGGGFKDEEHAYKFRAAGGRAVRQLLGRRHHVKMKTDPVYYKRVCAKMKAKRNSRKSIPHTKESKAKTSATKKGTGTGKNNSQFGTCWVNKEGSAKKIKKQLLDQFISDGWSKGRK